MYRKRIKPFYSEAIGSSESISSSVCVCLGTRITDQMYHGVDSSNSTLISGEFDDPDCWDVDPACDMRTDRFDLDVKTPVPVSEPPASE